MKKITKGPISARDRELMVMPTIQSQLPIVFQNKTHFDQFQGKCSQCGSPIPNGLVAGQVTRPTEAVAVIEAIGACPKCKIGMRFLLRVHDDLRCSGRSGGKWVTWKARKRMGTRLKEFLAWLSPFNIR